MPSLQPNRKSARGQRQVTTGASRVDPEAAQSLQLCSTVTDPEQDVSEHGLAWLNSCVSTLHVEVLVAPPADGASVASCQLCS